MQPTPQQAQCLDDFATGRALRINAYAGTGKTSTLKMLSRATRKRGLYLAFNKTIADEAAREFPRSVQCRTVHGLAFRAMRSRFGETKMTGKLSGGFIAARMRLQPRTLADGTNISSRGLGFLVGKTVERWLRSADAALGAEHFPADGRIATLDSDARAGLVRGVLKEANALWARMSDPGSDMPLTHDGYLKVWALARPELPCDYALLDEAQDTNGVVLGLMLHQPMQVVGVGDRHQQIYEWRGARNAMVELPADLEARLSMSWRFGTAIADNATKVLRMLGETVPLTGNPDRCSALEEVAEPNAILCRTNATLISEVFSAIEDGKRPHVTGGVNEVLMYIDAAESLMAGKPVDMPLDFFGFPNWREVEKIADTEDGADLRRWVKLFDKYGTDNLRSMLERLPTRASDADLVLATGHKSKGLEWGKVRLADDFLRGVGENKKDGGKPRAEDYAEELRLFYVAVTRGKVALEVPAELDRKMALLTPIAPLEPMPVAPPTAPAIVARPSLADEFEAFDPATVETASTVSDEVLPPITKLAPPPASDEFEAFDPVVLEKPAKPAKTYPSRIIPCACPKCGYLVSTTRKWLKLGAPICPVDNVPLAAR